MNNQGAIQCKVKLVTDGEEEEMRRFQLDDSSFASNFDLFRDKLRAVFPQLQGTPFKVLWTDSEGDSITIGNDEELLMAMMSMHDVKILEVHNSSGSKEEPAEEVFESFACNSFPSVVTCDVCDMRITRYRYKCLQCQDYDLCQNCEQAGNHSQHVMVRLADVAFPRGFPKMMGHWSRTARKAAHHAAKEAYRGVKSAAKAAHYAAKDAHHATKGSTSRCPYRQASEKQSGSGCASQEIPPFDTGVLFDMASSFLGPFMNPQTQGTAPTANPTPEQPQTQGAASAGTAAGSTAGTGTATPTQSANPTQSAANSTPVDVLGNLLRDVFSAINANVAQAASDASTPAPSTPTPTPAPTPAATPAQTPAATNPTQPPTTTNPTPMDVEQPATSQTAPIYPNVPKAADAGWTFVNTPPSAPIIPEVQIAPEAQRQQPTMQQPMIPTVAPTAAPLNPDQVKYASQLGQLRRMGFSDSIDFIALLKRYNGNIGMVVNHLFESGGN